MKSKHTKFAGLHHVLNNLSIKEVAPENGFESITVDDIEILKTTKQVKN